ncbi:hypothetical protein [Paenibacillus wulumuqiensis]|uniref:hypothetical protein n=1 Tax=Paenibacillus wulumuqiensis TaxID=1567107 RepID=UPI0012DD9A42|nr:hypothetical protein [Paenibacillus wulumuqiensis]
MQKGGLRPYGSRASAKRNILSIQTHQKMDNFQAMVLELSVSAYYRIDYRAVLLFLGEHWLLAVIFPTGIMDPICNIPIRPYNDSESFAQKMAFPIPVSMDWLSARSIHGLFYIPTCITTYHMDWTLCYGRLVYVVACFLLGLSRCMAPLAMYSTPYDFSEVNTTT